MQQNKHISNVPVALPREEENNLLNGLLFYWHSFCDVFILFNIKKYRHFTFLFTNYFNVDNFITNTSIMILQMAFRFFLYFFWPQMHTNYVFSSLTWTLTAIKVNTLKTSYTIFSFFFNLLLFQLTLKITCLVYKAEKNTT